MIERIQEIRTKIQIERKRRSYQEQKGKRRRKKAKSSTRTILRGARAGLHTRSMMARITCGVAMFAGE